MNPAPPAPAASETPKAGPSNLRLRVIWGFLAAALLMGCVWGGPLTFGLFFAGVQAVMLKEFYRIMRAKGYRPAFWWGIVVGFLLFEAVNFSLVRFSSNESTTANNLENFLSEFARLVSTAETAVVGGLALVTLLPTALVIRALLLWPRHEQPFANIAVTMLGLLYVSVPMTALNYLALGEGGYTPRRVFSLILLVWAADTGAYFAGKQFGRRKLAPNISPGKTWEGWAGGALLTLFAAWVLVGWLVPAVPLSHRLVAGAVVAVFGPLGDLAESMLKRSAGVKDSGTFLPGHGGLLDRFDAFLLVLPVLALLQVLAG